MSGEAVQLDRYKRFLGQVVYTDTNFAFENVDTINTSTAVTAGLDIQRSYITKFFNRDTTLLILFSGLFYINGGDPETDRVRVAVKVDGVELTPDMENSYDGFGGVSMAHFIVEVAAGEHTVNAVLAHDASATNSVLEDGILTVFELVQ